MKCAPETRWPLGFVAGLCLLQLTNPARPNPPVRNDFLDAMSPPGRVSSPVDSSVAGAGRNLFLKNCAHCHGADARGDEGPDLRNIEWTDQQIAIRIRNGKKGQMTAFAGKLKPGEIELLVAYVRTLK